MHASEEMYWILGKFYEHKMGSTKFCSDIINNNYIIYWLKIIYYIIIYFLNPVHCIVNSSR